MGLQHIDLGGTIRIIFWIKNDLILDSYTIQLINDAKDFFRGIIFVSGDVRAECAQGSLILDKVPHMLQEMFHSDKSIE
jgi:hypothetical protein